MSESSNKNSRRKFLKNFGITIGAAGIVSGTGAYAVSLANEGTEKEVVMTTNGELVEVDKKSKLTKKERKEKLSELTKRGREGIPGKKWVMVVNLANCRNARACMNACQNAHHLEAGQHHINVLRMQSNPHTSPYFMPKPCQHCDNPPCTKVCPVDATFKRQDGIVLIDNERCIGCRFCIAACPYSARTFNWLEPKKVEGDEDRVYDIELNVPQKKGTISKCLFSADRLREEKMPYCVSACPNGVYWFGDLNEDSVTNGTTKETYRFSDLIRENAGFLLMPELGTKPSVYYLPPKDRLFPFNYKGKTTLEDEHHH